MVHPVIAYVFVITLMIPSFGGEVAVTVRTATQDGCWNARRAVQSLLREIRAHVSACAEVTP